MMMALPFVQSLPLIRSPREWVPRRYVEDLFYGRDPLTSDDAAAMKHRPLLGVLQDEDPGQFEWLRHALSGRVQEWTQDAERLFDGDNAVLVGRFVSTRGPAYHRRFRGRNVFLVDLADENYDFSPEVYANFRGVLRCHWSDVFHPEAVFGLPLGLQHHEPYVDLAPRPASERQYVWSFLGQVNKSSRPEMAMELLTVEPHLLFGTDDLSSLSMWNRSGSRPRRYTPERCAEILLDSVFAPSPMGNVNVECWRMYEALESGTIPIVERRLGLDYFRGMFGPHPLPTVSSWSEARALMRQTLKDPGALDALQSTCLAWWAEFKASLPGKVSDFLDNRMDAGTVLTPGDIVKGRHGLPGWQAVELLRHHTVPAAVRRGKLLAARLLKREKLRVASGARPRQ